MLIKNKMKFDTAKINCLYKDSEGKIFRKSKNVTFKPRNIQSISIKPCRERDKLKVVASERIIIRSSILPRPIEYYKIKEGKFFDEYKAGVRLFCMRNDITIYDEAE